MSATKTAILLAAFGATSARGNTAIDAFEQHVRHAFPDIPVRWAFTSPRARKRLAQARVKSDSVAKALARLHFEKHTHVAVQSLHIIPGSEFESLQTECTHAANETGLHITVGNPLLTNPEDVQAAANALLYHLPPERKKTDLVLCMGHGTSHTAARSYAALAAAVHQHDSRVFIGTLDGERNLEAMLPLLQAEKERTVWLLPLLSVIGKHAEYDMAGDEPGCWKHTLEAEGFTCHPVLRGTAEYSKFTRIWLAHLTRAMNLLIQ